MPKKVTVRQFEPENMTSDAEAIAELALLHNETAEALYAAVTWLEKLQGEVDALKKGSDEQKPVDGSNTQGAEGIRPDGR